MTDAFLSYSRIDAEFAQRLVTALVAEKQTVWFDTHDIPPAAEWLPEVGIGIDNANNFLVLLTPNWVASRACAQELQHAVAANKRILPLCHIKQESSKVDHAVTKQNYIFCRETDDFALAVKAIVAAMHTDYDWVHAHTRLQVRAHEWESKHQDASYLLGGSDLKDAESWLGRSAGQPIQPTSLQAQYIVASRQFATRRSRIVFTVLVAFALFATVLAVYALLERNHAQRQARVANAGRLAALSGKCLQTDPQCAILLALYAIDATGSAHEPPTPESLQALHTAIQSSPLRISISAIPQANASPGLTVSSLRFMIDGRQLLATVTSQYGGSSSGGTATLDVADPTPGNPSPTPNRLKSWSPFPAGSGPSGPAPAPNLLAIQDPANLLFQPASSLSSLSPIPSALGQSILTHIPAFRSAALSADGALLATCNSPWEMPATIALWDTRTWRSRTFVAAPANLPPPGIVISPDGSILATVTRSQGVKLWSASTLELLGSLNFPGNAEQLPIAFSPDGKYLAAASESAISLWQASSQTLLWSLTADSGTFESPGSIAFSPDSSRLAVGFSNGNVRLFAVLPSGELLARQLFPAYRQSSGDGLNFAASPGIRALTISPSPDLPSMHLLASGPMGQAAYLSVSGNLTTLTPSGKDSGNPDAPDLTPNLALSPDASAIASLSCPQGSGTISSPAGKLLSTLQSCPASTSSSQEYVFAFSGDGQRVARAASDGVLRVWSVHGGQPIVQIPVVKDRGEGYDIATVSLDAAGRRAAVAYIHQPIRIYDLASGRVLSTIDTAALKSASDAQSFQLVSHMLALSPDGTVLATASFGFAAVLWDTATGKPIHLLKGESGDTDAIAFSRDGKLLAAATHSGAVRLWSVADGSLSQILPAASVKPSSVAFSHDGRILAVGDDADTVRLYALDPAMLQSLAWSRITRTPQALTPDECDRYFQSRVCPPLPPPAQSATGK